MADFADQLEGLLQEYGGLVNLTVEEREKMTQAGADVLSDAYSKAAKDAGHYNRSRELGKMKHLADSVETGRLVGSKVDGAYAVGFSKKEANHARIARFLNDGTRYIKGDSFIDNAREKSQQAVLKAQANALKAIQDKKTR